MLGTDAGDSVSDTESARRPGKESEGDDNGEGTQKVDPFAGNEMGLISRSKYCGDPGN